MRRRKNSGKEFIRRRERTIVFGGEQAGVQLWYSGCSFFGMERFTGSVRSLW